MTTTPRKTQDYKARKQITLSPEALAALKPPLEATGTAIYPADSTREIFTVFIRGSHYRVENEIAAFIAALVNEALTPAAPAALCEYDDCDQAALPGGELCTTHQAALAPMRRCYSKSACEPDCPWRVNCLDDLGPAPAVTISPETTTELRQLVTTELEAEQRWTAEDIMRREG